MEIIIAGVLYLALGWYLVRYSAKNKVSKGEWFTFCLLYCNFLIILSLGLKSSILLCFNTVCFILFIFSSFFLKFTNYKKEKADFLKKPHHGLSVVCAELVDMNHAHNSSMRVLSDNKEFGSLTPHTVNDYEFSYYTKGIAKVYTMRKDSKEFLLQGVKLDYSLYRGDNLCLKIKKKKRNRVELKTANACIEASIYKRHIFIFNGSEQVLELHLYPEGFFLACKEQEREIFLCYAYYAWLVIFGIRRRDI